MSPPDTGTVPDETTKSHPLRKFSLQGQAQHLDEMAVEQKALLGSICLSGQSTVFCAPPNAGKTLITLSLIIDAIEGRRIAAENVIYVNADDTTSGIADKVRILDEYGGHMLGEGYNGFQAKMLTGALEQMIAQDKAKGCLVILDTFKKFSQLMSKQQTSEFTNVVRRFVLKGGTLLCLSHTNKSPGADGKNVFAGVSDIIDDLDCAYVIDVTAKGADRIAVFTNRKRRGDVPDIAAYAYSADPALSYTERLLTVQQTDTPEGSGEAPKDIEVSDQEVLYALAMFIHHGNGIGKMELVRATAQKANTSKMRALKLLERFTGDDPKAHRWNYSVGARGVHAYHLLGEPPRSVEDAASF